jgi:hypothetical protein
VNRYRQRAISLRLAGRPTTAICAAVGRSEVWFRKWWGRYLESGPEGLYDLTALDKGLALRQDGTSEDFFFLAMAHQRAGHKHEAHKWCDKSIAWMDKYAPKDPTLLRYRTEAASVLGIKSAQTLAMPVAHPGQAAFVKKAGDEIAAVREARYAGSTARAKRRLRPCPDWKVPPPGRSALHVQS